MCDIIRMGKSGELDNERLRALALHYVGRYATTQAKLKTYLTRKIRERGWKDEQPPALAELIARLAELGYVDDAVYAGNKAASLKRKGLGSHRISAALGQAGIARELAHASSAMNADEALAAAREFARRKRIGPFARSGADPALLRKWMGSMMRAGHNADIARTVIMTSLSDLSADDGEALLL